MKEYEPILNNIKRYVSLNADDEKQFIAIVRKSRVKKRQFIVQPRFVCTHQTYVVKGALRVYFVNKNGNEHTLQFAIDDWFASDHYSYIHQTPASIFIEALEDSYIQQIEYNDVERLCLENQKFERFFRKVAQKSFAFAQRRILSNLDKTAEERYLEFMEMYPDIIQKVPQYAVASYLGMTPEFLSKIRKKIALQS
jgi:CRP-like cAMP-binding protein